MNKMSLSLNVAEKPTKHAKYIEVKTNIADTTLVKIEITQEGGVRGCPQGGEEGGGRG